MWNYNENMDEMTGKIYWTSQKQLIAAGYKEITVRDNNGFVEGYIYK